jgi:hypothetical protein
MVDTLNPQPACLRHFTSKFSGSATPDFAMIPIQPFVKPAFVQGRLLPVSVTRAQSWKGYCWSTLLNTVRTGRPRI